MMVIKIILLVLAILVVMRAIAHLCELDIPIWFKIYAISLLMAGAYFLSPDNSSIGV